MIDFNVMETIKLRKSVRRYADKTVGDSVKNELTDYIQGIGSGPFGTTPRFQLLDLEPLKNKELRSLGTYGFIRGARLYLLGAIDDQQGAHEDLGFCLENIILKATSLGLGTCWLGGTFKRAAFANRINLASNELLPAITPVGWPEEKISTADSLIRFMEGSKKRKPWSALFLKGDGDTALSEAEANEYKDVLEAVRMGPSASNRQPWRIIKDGSDKFHFYMKENIMINRIISKVRLQNIDMGIAMSHFEMTARAKGLPGGWIMKEPPFICPGLKYIATWTLNKKLKAVVGD